MVDLSIAMLVHQRVTIINQDQSALTYFDVWYPTMVPPSRGPPALPTMKLSRRTSVPP